jgi:phosphoglycerate dehydrogenase-like enzyme
MALLIVEALENEVMEWLSSRHDVRFAPALAHDPRAFRQSLRDVRALVIPPCVTLDAKVLYHAPRLRAVGRVSAGAENLDAEACARAGVEVVRSITATAAAEAEFMIGALLSLLRRVPVVAGDGMPVGRELGACTVGLVGMAPAARTMAQMLAPFGASVVGYDPSLHASDEVWARWNVRPLGLRELLESCDAVCVLLNYFSRYHGLLGERLLPCCKPDQVIVSIGHSSLFDERSLADALSSGRIAAAWLDSVEPGALDPGRPLHGMVALQVTPRLASTTRESRARSAWMVARRIDQLLAEPVDEAAAFSSTLPAAGAGPEAGPASQ